MLLVLKFLSDINRRKSPRLKSILGILTKTAIDKADVVWDKDSPPSAKTVSLALWEADE